MVCGNCKGEICPDCNGRGQVPILSRDPEPKVLSWRRCDKCEAMGELNKNHEACIAENSGRDYTSCDCEHRASQPAVLHTT